VSVAMTDTPAFPPERESELSLAVEQAVGSAHWQELLSGALDEGKLGAKAGRLGRRGRPEVDVELRPLSRYDALIPA
jgi:hypothetical protein